MRRWVLGALAALMLPVPASAATNTYPVHTNPPYFICKVTTTAATSCVIPGQTPNGAPPQVANTPSFLIGFHNNSTTAQTANVTCYDNPTAASGYQVAVGAAFAAGAVLSFSTPGIPLESGLTCIASAAITGDSVEVFFR